MKHYSDVAIVQCAAYGQDVESSVRRALEQAGVMPRLNCTRSRVLVKPNLIHAALPAKATTTHPDMVRAVVRVLREAGHSVIIADSYSGAFRWTTKRLEEVYRATGMMTVAEECDCELNFDLAWQVVQLPDGSVLRRVELLKAALEADWIVNVPKLKTHAYTGFTCAVKNLFGLVPGHYKVGYHARFAAEDRFSRALSDIASHLPVKFTVVDGIVAMEGNGPTGGLPRSLGVVMAGIDLRAVDGVAARFCGIRSWNRAGPGSSPISVAGPLPEEIVPLGLRKPTTSVPEMGILSNNLLRSLAANILRGVYSPVPRIEQADCRRCLACANGCPRQAVSQDANRMTVDKKRCIRCYCCSEACEYGAVTIPESRFARWLA